MARVALAEAEAVAVAGGGDGSAPVIAMVTATTWQLAMAAEDRVYLYPPRLPFLSSIVLYARPHRSRSSFRSVHSAISFPRLYMIMFSLTLLPKNRTPSTRRGFRAVPAKRGRRTIRQLMIILRVVS